MNTHFFLIWMITVALSLSQACDKEELKGSIQECISKDGENVQNMQHVADGTRCLVDTNKGEQIWKCADDQWYGEHGLLQLGDQKRRQKRWFLGKVFKAFTCVLTLLSCLWSGRSGPPPDRTPPDLNCTPLIETGIADPFQTYAQVYWTYPSAHDDKGGHVRIVRTSGRASGRHFPEGNTYVDFTAIDNSGNKRKCTKTIKVTVIRCSPPTPIKNGYFICYPSTEFVLGGWCRFGCYDGFDLKGESTITCKENGQWTAAQPICKAWTCPSPELIDGADKPACTNGVRFRSICSYNCKTGFDMPPKVSKTMVCSIRKRWRRFGTPKCIDVEPPMMEHCPTTKVFGTDTGVNTSHVTWKMPVVRDNSGKQIRPKLTKGFPSETKLTAGTYSIEYAARDDEGNSAKPCKFTVIVRDIRCPKLYPTPYVRMQCPDGYRTGAGCNVSCDPGKTRQGSEYVTCEKSMKGMYGKWNWKFGHQTTCISTHHCPSLEAPVNGAIACDNWSGGEFCQLQCKEGTRMSSASWRKLLVCSNRGDWFPSPVIRPCKELRHPRPALGVNANYYFHGDCTDETTKSIIASNFIAALKSSLYEKEACPNSADCVNNNVMVTCGSTKRTRREALIHNNTSSMTLTIHITFPLSEVHNTSEYSDTIGEIKNLMNLTANICNDSPSLIFGETPVIFNGVENLGLDVECEEGHVKVENSLSCVECPVGTLYNSNTQECDSCAKGTYQDRGGQSTCKRCPYATTTRHVGASSIHDCEAACAPGTFSIDGTVPCSPCEHGEYQSSFGRQKCHRCHGSTTTVTTGAIHRSECQGDSAISLDPYQTPANVRIQTASCPIKFDIALPTSGNKTATITLLKPKTFQSFILSFWIRQESNETDDMISITFLNGEHLIWQLNNQHVSWYDRPVSSFEMRLPDNRWHNVQIESRTCNLTGFLDGIPVAGLPSTGQCNTISFNKVDVSAGDGFGGSISQLNIWNGTSYTPPPSRCFHSRVAASVSWQEFGDAELTESYIHLPSSCDDHDNCVSSPCRHGNCTDALHGYHCDCDNGFTGQQCDINIDDCQANICMNNATCVDKVNSYTCTCPDSFTGTYCEILKVHGQWSEWSNWTECTTTCGQGSQSRKRLCNNPYPDNGGRNCTGETTEFVPCNNTDCPVCPSIESPVNGSMECKNESETITCTLSCNEGFDFDTRPLDNYTCGPDTLYVWNFQTEENPDRKLPKCTAKQMPEKLTVHYSVKYLDLYCSSEELTKYATNRILNQAKAALNTLHCIGWGTCSLDALEITDCSPSKQQRRSVSTAGVSLEISTKPDKDNANETLQDLQDAFKKLQMSAENGAFTVDISDDEYEIDVDSTLLSGKAKCKPGTTRVSYYCVPCGVGSYSFEDYCKPCVRGSYQNVEGQLYCLPCPEGKTTLGIGATGIQDCTVAVPSIPVEIKVTAIAVGSACAVFVVIVLIFAYRRYRSGQQRKIVSITDINLPVKGNHVDNLGPAKIKFINKSNGHIEASHSTSDITEVGS